MSEGTVYTTLQGLFNSESGTRWHERCQNIAWYRLKWHSQRLSAGCVMKTISCCLREAVFLLPPAPGSKTDQRHKPTY